MEKLFVLFSADEWISRNSFALIGVFDSMKMAIHAANEFDGYNLSADDKKALEKILQTQGRERNYFIHKVVLNEIQ